MNDWDRFVPGGEMGKTSLKLIAVLAILVLAAMACNLPGSQAPTPFVFPTPNLTMTAVFNPTQVVLPTNTQAAAEIPTNQPATASLTPVPSDTATMVSPTAVPTNTPVPTQSYAGPGMRQEFSVAGVYFSDPPTMDGSLEEWGLDRYLVDKVVYGADLRSNINDLSGNMMVAWDNDYLYIGLRVKDDNYVQNASGINLFKGDSIEVLMDTNVSSDYYLKMLDGDDFQLGISPGSPKPGKNPEAYLWYPSDLEGKKSNVEIGSQKTDDGYRIEMAIPWSIFKVTPKKGAHFGFAVSISDNDKSGENIQQSMVSNDPNRRLTDPTTWGDLTLIR